MGSYPDLHNRISALVHIIPSNKIVSTGSVFFSKMSEYYSVSGLFLICVVFIFISFFQRIISSLRVLEENHGFLAISGTDISGNGSKDEAGNADRNGNASDGTVNS